MKEEVISKLCKTKWIWRKKFQLLPILPQIVTTFAAYVGTKQQTTDFTGPLLFVTLAEFSSGELSQPTKASIAMEVEPKCALLTNSRETIAKSVDLKNACLWAFCHTLSTQKTEIQEETKNHCK